MRVSIQICSKDRATEVALLLQSLRTQTFQDFDVIILDDASGTPLNSFHFIQALLTRLKLENHRVKLLRNDFSTGVCSARQKLIDEDEFDNELMLRLDDDCIPEPEYIYMLRAVIMKGYDIATGVIPLLMAPEIIRSKIPNPICLHKLNEKGELVERKDELAYCYEHDIVSCHQFRTNALIKREVFKKIKYPINLSNVGFREELWISFQAVIQGFKIGCYTAAVAYHLQTPSGGCRDPEYNTKVQLDEETSNKQVKKWFLKYGDFLK